MNCSCSWQKQGFLLGNFIAFLLAFPRISYCLKTIMAFDYVIRPSDQKTLLNPLGLEWCANVRIAYSLVSAKTGNKIIEKTDIFVDGSSVEIEKSDSRNMFVKWFNKLIEEDKKNAPSERHLD